MTEKKYEKYIVKKPKFAELAHHAKGEVRGFTYPYLIYLDSDLVKGSPVFVDMMWRTEIPYPNPISEPHSHPYDEILFYIGSDPNNPQDLGGELEIQLDDERYSFDTTTVIFVPRGVTHTCRHIRVDKPILNLGVSLSGGEYV